MVFYKNRIFSHGCFLDKLSQKRLFFDFPDRKECFLNQKSKVFKKAKKSKFFKGVSACFLSKNPIFSLCIFWTNQPKNDHFFNILYRKEWFLNQKSEVLKKSKK